MLKPDFSFDIPTFFQIIQKVFYRFAPGLLRRAAEKKRPVAAAISPVKKGPAIRKTLTLHTVRGQKRVRVRQMWSSAGFRRGSVFYDT